MNNQLEAPASVRAIVQRLEEAGFPTWAVGGAVRDAILGIGSGDWDLASKATPEEVMRVFRRTVPVGVDHGTVGVFGDDGLLYEVTTFRRDVETFGRRAVVEFAETLHEDLARRDFTINAIAWHPLRDEVQDPFDGIHDLREGILRAVGDAHDRIREDYLRILRGLRFAGRFSLEIEDATWQAICDLADGLKKLSAERIREELLKIMQQDARPSTSLSLYADSGALDRTLAELAAVSSGAPDRWARILDACDSVSPRRALLRVAIVMSPIMEGRGPAEGEAMTRSRLEALRFSNAEVARVAHTVRSASSPPAPECSEADARRWLARNGTELLPEFIRVWIARGRAGIEDGVDLNTILKLRSAAGSGAPLRVGDLAFTGSDLIRLGYAPGPSFGRVFERLLDEVLERPELNAKEPLGAMAVEMLGPPAGGSHE